MCTLSWIETQDTLEVFFNRDEQRGRGPEQPPSLHREGGIPYLAPLDSDAGGTWIAANAAGVVVALLNGYTQRRGPAAAKRRSRGLLVRDLASHLTRAEPDLDAADLEPYDPLHLVLLAPGLVRAYRWDGLEWSGPETPQAPVVSSGWNPEAVRPHRESLWRTWQAGSPPTQSAEALAYHGFAPGGGDAFSPCMRRDDAATRSLCHIRIAANRVSMRYAPGPPDQTPLGPPQELPLLKPTH
ncbi:MAG: NRDE family protein [Planctomycetes bacterium]|nr:NRDE family protein [Planctomycetota bacterium]MCB9912988.1 NRDE family protein [Planctomycetota bacterium]HPF13170.1 NRDE family protein [Planctomycetota bacterium]HRV80648.1 NRDE family protein [Planctomycetota bacterium]